MILTIVREDFFLEKHREGRECVGETILSKVVNRT